MFITNDVSLITFVPFAMLTLRKCNQEKFINTGNHSSDTRSQSWKYADTYWKSAKFISLQSCRDENVNIYRNYRSIYVNIRYIAAVIRCCCMQKKMRRLNLHSKKITATMKLKNERLHLRRKAHQKNCSLSDFISDESACCCESIAVLCGFHCCVCDGLYHGQTSVENGRLQFNSHIYRFFHFYWEYRRN